MQKYITLSETDHTVADYLKANNIYFSSRYLGEKKVWDSRQVSDHWLVKIGSHDFDFYTGIGHRLGMIGTNYILTTKQCDSVKPLRDMLGKNRLDETVIKLGNSDQYAVSPTQASVLYCLLLDASGAEQNFNDWCADFGYDNDSISAFKTYQACCDILEKMRKIFTTKQRNELSELLQDY
jgi:hypothetical protein